MLEVARHTDLFLYDLKMMDPATHRQWTGVSNELILNNLRALSETGVPVNIRIPVVGGINDSEENIRHTARFLAGLKPGTEVSLLPYHPIAQAKYAKLERPDGFLRFQEPDKSDLEKFTTIFREHGIRATMGG
jgi:pyruvate formate lyase activating enzyme